jgi:hypothetical protein
MSRFKLGQLAGARADFERAIKWQLDHPNPVQPGWSEELAAFRAETAALLAHSSVELPADAVANLR